MENNEYIREHIKELCNEIKEIYDKIVQNKQEINQNLSKFIVGNPIGDGVYSSSSTIKNYDIILPSSEEEYKRVIHSIHQDLENIEILESKNKNLKLLMQENDLDNEVLEIGTKCIELSEKIILEKEEKIDILYRLENTWKLLEEQKKELNNNQDNEIYPSETDNSMFNSSNSGISSEESNIKNRIEESRTEDNKDNYQLQDNSSQDYKAVLTFSTLQNVNMETTKENLESYEKSIAGILSNLELNGEIIGANVYGVNAKPSTSDDISFDFGALQLALDYIDTDIKETQTYINQLTNKISENKTKMKEIQTKIDELTNSFNNENVSENNTDDFNNSKYDIASLQKEMDTLEKENEKLEKEKTSYITKLNQKKEVLNQYISVRNAYNKAYGGMVSVFTTQDLLNEFGNSTNNKYGISLSNEEKKEMFNKLKDSLESSKGNYSLVTKDDYDVTKKEISIEAYNYLLNSCSILGNLDTTFEDSQNKWEAYKKEYAESVKRKRKQTEEVSSNEDIENNQTTLNQDSTPSTSSESLTTKTPIESEKTTQKNITNTRMSIPSNPTIAAKKQEWLGDVDDASNYTEYTGKTDLYNRHNTLELFDNTTGEVIQDHGKITLKPGETRVITVKLPNDTGMINQITRTTADGDGAYRSGKIVTARSDIDPDPNNIEYVRIAEGHNGSYHKPNNMDLLHNNSYDWIITANAKGNVKVSQTCLWTSSMTNGKNLKAMINLNVEVKDDNN